MARLSPLASLAALGLASSLACREPPPVERHYPMRAPPAGHAPSQPLRPPDPSAVQTETGDTEPSLGERPSADPEIERALDLISASGLRFIDQAEAEDERPSEYTAEQFASMLRSKWDWIGYDIVELDAWLDEIASRSFKTNLPYQVVLGDGTTTELRPWLDHELVAHEDRRDPVEKNP